MLIWLDTNNMPNMAEIFITKKVHIKTFNYWKLSITSEVFTIFYNI